MQSFCLIVCGSEICFDYTYCHVKRRLHMGLHEQKEEIQKYAYVLLQELLN